MGCTQSGLDNEVREDDRSVDSVDDNPYAYEVADETSASDTGQGEEEDSVTNDSELPQNPPLNCP
jgi:hypothetical protein